ncbi:hypothetical protein [Serratia quinivorans]|jgi:hypothetical protein|uniref:hypothetical protein n=1 Tax=Serratia quinivorans TaxID=137545 RepID=UPI002176FDBD|nr:hypothetical protein [Serratia quinivorans]CAI0728529.1 Uncharacterised protein [Serratia quinivorans]
MLHHLNCNIVDFSGSYARLNGSSGVKITEAELLWAMITVGKRYQRQLLINDEFSFQEIINRITLIRSILDLSNNEIYKSVIYKNSDPTEKTFMSFMLGMAISKLLSQKLINVPWLAHLHMLKTPMTYSHNTKSRPDLIGRNPQGDYVIVEAKGTSGKYNDSTQTKALNQLNVIKTVNGVTPILYIASQLYFDTSMSAKFQDPESDQDGLDIEFSDNEYFGSYYYHLNLLANPRFVRYISRRYGVSIKLTEQLQAAMKIGDFSNFSKVILEGKGHAESYIDNEGFHIFGDGLKIRIDNRDKLLNY